MIPKTIEDAKKGWCPSAMVSKKGYSNSYNRDVVYVCSEIDPEGVPKVQIPDGCNCLATECATWVAIEKDMGFCGLARC